MPWSNEKIREYRRHGDGREKKRVSDKEYEQKNRASILDRALERAAAPGAPAEKACIKCKVIKPFDHVNYMYAPRMKWKLSSACRACRNEYSLVRITMKKYGMTLEEAQSFKSRPCEICGAIGHPGGLGSGKQSGRGLRMSVDHCHDTNKIRGALCSKCNTGIGQFDEDRDRMLRAIAYLDRHKNG